MQNEHKRSILVEKSIIFPKLINKKSNRFQIAGRKWYKNWQLYALLVPSLVYLAVFAYAPMYGVIIAFKDYNSFDGIFGSQWVGFENFRRFFDNYLFWDLIKNTLSISFFSIIVNTPLPIILALLINEVRNKFFRSSVQMISYAPYFVSVVVAVGMTFSFLNPERGVINEMIKFFGGQSIAFMESPSLFLPVYITSGVWQGLGWWSIIYVGTLANVDPSLHEAATIDGAGRFKRMWHINIPAIIPIATIMLILSIGSLLSVGFEKVYLMQTQLNLPASTVIPTYVYEVSLKSNLKDFSFGTAVGLFNTFINLILLISANVISKKVDGESLW
jgi:putative aldouronate transport system permease protein